MTRHSPSPDPAGGHHGVGHEIEARTRHDGPHAIEHDDEAGELLELLYGLMRDLRREATAGPGVTTPGQQRLLRALRNAGEPRRPGELAAALDVAARSVTSKVDQAEADGLVRRVADPRDRRATLVELTDAGRAALAEFWSRRQAGAATRLERLEPAEREQLLGLLRRLRGQAGDCEGAGSAPGPGQPADR